MALFIYKSIKYNIKVVLIQGSGKNLPGQTPESPLLPVTPLLPFGNKEIIRGKKPPASQIPGEKKFQAPLIPIGIGPGPIPPFFCMEDGLVNFAHSIMKANDSPPNFR